MLLLRSFRDVHISLHFFFIIYFHFRFNDYYTIPCTLREKIISANSQIPCFVYTES